MTDLAHSTPDAGGACAPAGRLGLTLVRSNGARERIIEPAAWPSGAMDGATIRRFGLPQRGLDDDVNRWRARNAPRLLREGWRLAAARRLGIAHLHGALWLTLDRDGERIDLGLASLRLVTDNGVAYIVDAFQNLTEPENMKFHGYGTGTTAEAANQTGLITELTTQYVGDVRPTGSTTEAAANVYRSVGTLSPDAGGTIAVTEHGIFSAASAGVLLDRSVFSAVNVVASADSLQTTYDLTFASGG